MHYPHRIRLRGPWDFEPLARTASPAGETLPSKGRMTMPGRWREGGLNDFAGRVLFRRRFGFPGRLDPTDRVWLTFAGVEGMADVLLNSQILGRREGELGPFEFEVTGLLQARNELIVEIEAPASGGLWGEVALEVRCTAFLRAVRACATRAGAGVNLHVAGELVGTADRPLELYVLLDGSTVAYTNLEAAVGGRPFNVVAEGLSVPATTGGDHAVRIELVNGAVVWYRIDTVVSFPGEGAGPGE
jgi:hypothetical protein